MGNRERRKPPSQRGDRRGAGRAAGPPLTPRQEFQYAMVAECAAELARTGGPCVICRKAGWNVGIWTPTRPFSDELGAPPGKHRVVVYALCNEHADLKAWGTAVEDTILADARARRAEGGDGHERGG